jgi:hypothetical protein
MDLEKKIELLRYALSIRFIFRKILAALIAKDYDLADSFINNWNETWSTIPGWLMAYTNVTNKETGIRDDAARAFGASVALELFGPEDV